MLQPMLCGWFLYLAVLSILLGASAGRGTWLGRLAWLAALAALVRVGLVWRPVAGRFVQVGPLPVLDAVTLAPDLVILAAGAAALIAAPRTDTRLIGLLLAGAALFPLALHFW